MMTSNEHKFHTLSMTVNLPPACGGCMCTWLVLHYITLEFCIWLFELFEYSLLNQSDIICSHDIILYVNESLTDVLYLQKDNCPIKKQKQVSIINTIRIIT